MADLLPWRNRRADLLESIARQSWITPGGCWEWTGNLNESGYGRVNAGGRPQRAHRVSYRLFRGVIPQGVTLDHLCRNRACVNPGHLEPVDRATNVLRGESEPARNGRKSECKWGHPFDSENTGVYTDARGRRHRYCRACSRNRGAK